ncbi:MAG TPA: peroxiredoxin [Ktedonobacteraceae bacterium]|nr:peroxiredoxin [Ktedonobacteraceae bacterium]
MSTESKQVRSDKVKLQVGDRAPLFSLPTQSGSTVSLEEFLGKSVIVLYFYPKDNTSGCTAEACSFRDNYEVFKQAGAEVIGVSSDSTESHQKFASKYRLPFVLLSDKKGALRKTYGVPAALGVLPGRVTYVIDKQGVIRHIFNDMFNAQKHIEEALKVVQTISGE